MCRSPEDYLVNQVESDGTVRLEGVVGNGHIKLFTKAAALEWCKSCVTFGSARDHVLAVDDLHQGLVMLLTYYAMGPFGTCDSFALDCRFPLSSLAPGQSFVKLTAQTRLLQIGLRCCSLVSWPPPR
jgi:hypothetical protein